jgi:hypothetical protein
LEAKELKAQGSKLKAESSKKGQPTIHNLQLPTNHKQPATNTAKLIAKKAVLRKISI